jgi:hypothetical protein
VSGPDEPVPRLSRGRGLRLRTADVVRIGMFATLLVFLIVMGRPCADGVAGFVESFSPADAAPAAPAAPPIQLERLTEEQIRQRFPSGEVDAGATRPAPSPDPATGSGDR